MCTLCVSYLDYICINLLCCAFSDISSLYLCTFMIHVVFMDSHLLLDESLLLPPHSLIRTHLKAICTREKAIYMFFCAFLHSQWIAQLTLDCCNLFQKRKKYIICFFFLLCVFCNHLGTQATDCLVGKWFLPILAWYNTGVEQSSFVI